ncbi:MAG: hypothetical protein ACRDRO_29710 [Pseudonocardiaceae bacterium]
MTTSSEPPQWMSLACEKCGCEREVQLPREDGTFMTAEKYMVLHKVADMVLLCEDCAPVGSIRLGE